MAALRRDQAPATSPLYPHLFTPVQIGPKVARNRLWMTAHATQLVKDHKYSDEHIAYYAERAKGGVGVITMEATAVHPTTQPYAGKVFAFDHAVVDNYRKLAAAVHEHGCLLLAQPWHRGRETTGTVNRLPVWAPSSVPCTVYREMPHAMTLADIDEIVEGYTLAARYAAEGGLDGVEVHGLAHGYLLGQFLSPATNHRDDAYGGSAENRRRIVVEIVQRTRREVGPDAIVGVRINGDDGDVEGGLRTEDWAEIARTLADTGLIDYVSVSQGTYQDRMLIYGNVAKRAGYQLDATATIKEAVPELPVVAVGRINSPELAEWAVASGKADMVGMARALIADPEWPRKALEGRSEDIRPCVGANWCLAAITNSPLACIHNPAVGREATLGVGTLERAESPRRVAVIGAGPAGLRAALTAAQRGHEVALFEREDAPGGQVNWITRAGTYREWGSIVDWLVAQGAKAGVDLRLGIEANAETLLAEGWDAFVVATGSQPVRHGWSASHPVHWGDGSTLPGAGQWNVITPREALFEEVEVGPSVVVYDDVGSRQAVVVADYMLERRHQVEIVTPLTHVAPDLSASRDLGSVQRDLRRRGAVFTPNHEIGEIDGDRVALVDVHTGEVTWREPADAVVLVLGNAAQDGLLHELGSAGADVHGIGDCLAPRRIFNAIWEGELIGRSL